MAIADMFLKLHGVTGEAADAEHKGEIEVVSWSWGMQAPARSRPARRRKATVTELHIVKRVDQSSPTLMNFLRNNKLIETGAVDRPQGRQDAARVLHDRARRTSA